jgi:anti-sigma regulatory factor (Ser/Thr protein kinase)
LFVTQQHPGTSVRLQLEPAATAASLVRRELRQLTCSTGFARRLDDAQLAATELVTNAVLHGREPITVEIVVTADVLRVAVADGSGVSPSFSLLDPTAVTGRGLLLVASVADRWGVEPQPDGKTVWMELASSTPSADEAADIAFLLESWGDELATDPALEQVRVVLTDLDVPLLVESEAHDDALLRELALLAHADGTEPRLREAAEQILGAAGAFESVRGELKRQLAVAAAHDCAQLDVEVRLTRSEAELVRDYSHALEHADRLCAGDGLLTAQPRLQAASTRRDYLRRILAQLSS